MSMERPELGEIVEVVESLPFFNDGAILDDLDTRALLHHARNKMPHLGDELRTQADRLVEEIEIELEMDKGDEVIINEKILRGIVALALKVGAAQVIFDAGKTQHEIHSLRDDLQAS
jgi:hypothetical protein